MNDLFDLEGRIAVVTGGASGIGRMCTEALASCGAHVLIASRKSSVCEEVAAEINNMGLRGHVEGFGGDIATEEGVLSLTEEISRRTDRVDILVNNAGKTWGAPLGSFPYDAWNGIMAVNLVGPFALTQQLLPLLKRHASSKRPSCVVNVGSVAGVLLNGQGAYSYAASKAALHHVTRLLARELAAEHVTLNVIAPGLFQTRMTAYATADEKSRNEKAAMIPMKRLGDPDDISGALQYLCSRAGAYVTGAILALDGGLCVEVGPLMLEVE